MEPQRIAKFLSAAGACSRRDAEKLIAEGRVNLNGVVLMTPATLVSGADTITIDGEHITMPEAAPRLWVYHKPAGLITSHHDDRGRETVFDHLPRDLPRVISVGRLDLDSEGVLLLTTSGALSRAMELPRHAIEREYRVRLRGTPTESDIAQLKRGITVDGVHYKGIDVVLDARQTEGRNRWLTVTLREGKNREIRRLFEHYELPVSRLIRVRYGDFELGDLAPGALREIPKRQVLPLMELLGVV